MKKSKEKSNLSTSLCKKALSLSLTSLNRTEEECTFILFEPKQPEGIKKVDLYELGQDLKRI